MMLEEKEASKKYNKMALMYHRLRTEKKLFPREYALYSKQPYFCVWKVMKK